MPFLRSRLTQQIDAAAECGTANLLMTLSEQSDLSNLHGVAICTISDATSVYWTAETTSQRDSRIRDIHQRIVAADESCSISFDDVLEMYRYEPADWPLTDPPGRLQVFTELNDAIDEYWTYLERSLFARLTVSTSRAIRNVLSAISDGMQKAISNSELNFINWDETLALIWINDPDDPELVRHFARRLNNAKLYRSFSEHYFHSQ